MHGMCFLSVRASLSLLSHSLNCYILWLGTKNYPELIYHNVAQMASRIASVVRLLAS